MVAKNRIPKDCLIDESDYRTRFRGKELGAFGVAIEARRFEIQMYWTRTNYFWTLNAAALAGFFILQSRAKPDLFYGFCLACVGCVLSLGWSLASKGSKFWHENWENHVTLLEDVVIGPLHKTLLNRPTSGLHGKVWVSQVLTGPAGFSVSKINGLFGWFFFAFWIVLAATSIPYSSPFNTNHVDFRYIPVILVTANSFWLIPWLASSWISKQEHIGWRFETEVQDKDS